MNAPSPQGPGAAAAAAAAGLHASPGHACYLVLKPLSHPQLGDIRIDENLFAIGRSEAPFVSYAPEIVADLSRRHARIFSEYAAVYVADLGSKNGTTVNGVGVRQKIMRVQQGDEICFGRALSYRVDLSACAAPPARLAILAALTLSPELPESGLQAIVVTQFPFLISKADATFSQYRQACPHQVNYLSRRHAHIFLKGGAPFIEDLESTNGTFVNGKRLDEHAVALTDGATIAFGGHHFVYKVSLQEETSPADPTVTQWRPAGAVAAHHAGAEDRTTFVAAAGSFLDIFCVDQAQQQDDEVNPEAVPAAAAQEGAAQEGAAQESGPARARWAAWERYAMFIAELRQALAGRERKAMRRALWASATLAAVLGVVALLVYQRGAPERDVKNLMARGDYGAAATAANRYLVRFPEDAEVLALATEAVLKANLPAWLNMLKAGQFESAGAVLGNMRQARNADVQALAAELEWMADLEKFIAGRPGADAPIRIYADEEKIKTLLQRWNDDTMGHQRALGKIMSHVPQFKDAYALALSHLRKLQSDDSVYLAAIERLKAAIASGLAGDHPEALVAVLNEHAEKYPRIGGMQSLRQELRRYLDIDAALRAGNLAPLIAALANAPFSSPPFQAGLRTLAASTRLPAAPIIGQYQAVAKAWQAGETKQALATLQQMVAGPWAELASAQFAHKAALVAQFSALQPGAKGYDERLLAFYAALDPLEDVHFLRAVESDIGLIRDKALQRAQERLIHAQALWQQYQERGPIAGGQRQEEQISPQFRTQARQLSEAREDARQGMRLYAQLKAAPPAQWGKVQDEIDAEAEQQRRSLLALRTVLQPGLLKAKLALLGSPAA